MGTGARVATGAGFSGAHGRHRHGLRGQIWGRLRVMVVVTAIPAAAVADAASPVAGGAAAPVAGGRVGGSIASVDGETGTAEDSCGRPEGAELIAF